MIAQNSWEVVQVPITVLGVTERRLCGRRGEFLVRCDRQQRVSFVAAPGIQKINHWETLRGG